MRTITENFQIIINEQKRLGHIMPSLLQPPALTKEIQNAEQLLKFKFSDDLIELYSFANGISGLENPLGKIGILEIDFFMSLQNAVQYYKDYIQFDEHFTTWETNYKPGQHLFPLLQDTSGDCYWVDLNVGSENFNKIYWTNTYPESPAYVFSSLSHMFQTIAEGYKKNIFSLDEEGYLYQDDGWSQLCKDLNPDIQFWNSRSS